MPASRADPIRCLQPFDKRINSSLTPGPRYRLLRAMRVWREVPSGLPVLRLMSNFGKFEDEMSNAAGARAQTGWRWQRGGW